MKKLNFEEKLVRCILIWTKVSILLHGTITPIKQDRQVPTFVSAVGGCVREGLVCVSEVDRHTTNSSMFFFLSAATIDSTSVLRALSLLLVQYYSGYGRSINI
jgi:hypothetical protein